MHSGNLLFDEERVKTMAYIDVRRVSKIYRVGDIDIKAVNDVSFSVERGQFVVVIGPSGAGKTTVLNLLGGMDTPTRGKLILDGKDIAGFRQRDLVQYRRDEVGFVFQFYNLVGNLTALENVELATQICSRAKDAAKTLTAVGLKHRMDNFPAQLSGGEQQRVAIARALAKNPKLLLCDEPTGALDTETGRQILKLLQNTAKAIGMTVVLITHNTAITPLADKVIHFKNGKVEKEDINHHPISASEIQW